MSSLKEKAISGASWSLAGRFLSQGVQFIIGIILARLLTPDDYGLVAMASVFIIVSYVFVDSGFGTALIQRKNCTNSDYSTVFFLNLFVSVIVFTGLFFAAPSIANFYNTSELINIVRVLSFLLLFYAMTLVQNTIIIRDVNFKLKTRIELISQILSGVIAIYLAYKNFGVWALIWKALLNQVFINIQLWLKNNWFPSFEFSKKSFSELFSFGSKVLITGIIDSIYSQLNRLVVGKFFPAKELGYFTRAQQFQDLPSSSVSGALLSFLLPVFSKMQNEPERMKNAARKVIKNVMFFNIIAMILMGIVAEPMINVLLGAQWMGTVRYLQLLVCVGVFYPMQVINVQIITALGRSDLFLKIELLKKIIGIPPILLGIFIGIKAMILGMIATSIISLVINTYYTGKLINFGIYEQLKCISNSFLIALALIIILTPFVYFVGPQLNQLVLLLLISLLSFILVIFLSKGMKMDEYYELKDFVMNIINRNGQKK